MEHTYTIYVIIYTIYVKCKYGIEKRGKENKKQIITRYYNTRLRVSKRKTNTKKFSFSTFI